MIEAPFSCLRCHMKTPLLSALPFVLALGVSGHAHACPGTDKWIASDKAAHFGVSFGLGVAASQVTPDNLSAFGLALLPGLAKEIYDSQQNCDHFSWKDMAWDAVGAYLGVQTGNWYFGPTGVSYRKTF